MNTIIPKPHANVFNSVSNDIVGSFEIVKKFEWLDIFLLLEFFSPLIFTLCIIHRMNTQKAQVIDTTPPSAVIQLLLSFNQSIICVLSPYHNRGADPRARRMGAGRRPDHSRRAQSGQVACSGAKRRGKTLDEVSAAIPGGEAAGNVAFTGGNAAQRNCHPSVRRGWIFYIEKSTITKNTSTAYVNCL